LTTLEKFQKKSVRDEDICDMRIQSYEDKEVMTPASKCLNNCIKERYRQEYEIVMSSVGE
jgi:hypothetical protein